MEGDGDPIDEILDSRREVRRLPRWLILGAVAVVVAGLCVAVVRSVGPGTTAGATRTGSARPTPPTLSIPQFATVAASGDGRFVHLSGDALTLIDPYGGVVAQRRYPVRTVSTAQRKVRLVVDGLGGVVWAVSMDGLEPGYVEKFTYPDLHLVARIRLPAVATDAAGAKGDLYVTSAIGFFQAPHSGGGFRHIGGREIVSVTADEAGQHAVYLFRTAGGFTYDYIGKHAPLARPPAPVAVTSSRPRLTVVDGKVWGIGALDGRAWVARIGSTGFGPNVAPQGRTGATLAGVGDHTLFLRNGSGVDCFDTSAQRVIESYPDVDGPVAATRHRAITSGSDGVARALPLRACLG